MLQEQGQKPGSTACEGKPAGRTGVASRVEMMSWYLRVFSISDTMRAGRRSVAMKVVSRQQRMPAALISSG